MEKDQKENIKAKSSRKDVSAAKPQQKASSSQGKLKAKEPKSVGCKRLNKSKPKEIVKDSSDSDEWDPDWREFLRTADRNLEIFQ
ncbi:hypothetical protein A2U01_0039519 [Trifolium medium]|uniref:Uncharacterized protein n=1 Tax=Trifolium medium TaxID=97028 RepID=A0A392Q536_9FABA|nr:hypothetical protein [Trifolium medium]